MSRSYYRGAAGAVLVYDVANQRSFADLSTFLGDARALASPQLTVVLAGNKVDLADPSEQVQEDLIDGGEPGSLGTSETANTSTSTLQQTTLGRQQRATNPTEL